MWEEVVFAKFKAMVWPHYYSYTEKSLTAKTTTFITHHLI
jgi:hypothetical protein